MRSLQALALFASICAAGAVHAAAPLLSEDFENGSANWTAVDGNDIVISSDAAVCATHYQHETIATSGGRVVTKNALAVTGGSDYCISAWVRGSTDAKPFVGVRPFDVAGNTTGDHWVLGTGGTDNGFGGTVTAVTADGMWHWYAAHVTLDSDTTSLMVMDEVYQVDTGAADFDDITVTAGACAAQYAGADQHQVCGNDHPVCAADGSCQAAAPPPADMAGASSADMAGPAAANDMSHAPVAADMGATPAPGNDGSTAPTSPTSAGSDNTTTSTFGTNHIASSGGCSISSREDRRSLVVLMLAFIGVMIAAYRRRA